ncbi:MAG: DUF4860 domain-containing protein [Clostridia bacterium]|nr:DUF4860 domain-containing protein [Clostridia bacterium]
MNKTRMRFSDTSLFQLITYMFLIISVLTMIVIGSKLFAKVTKNKNNNENIRAELSYIQSQLASIDSDRYFEISEGPEGDMIVLKGENSYKKLIYIYDGFLTEEYLPENSPPLSGDFFRIVEAHNMNVSCENRLVIFSVDGNKAYFSLKGGTGNE